MSKINIKEIEVKEYVKTLEMMLTKDSVFMNSRQIAELTGKNHKKVLEDIRDELNKIQAMGKSFTKDSQGEELFRLSSYTNTQNKVQPMYVLSKSGIYQILARYSTEVRRVVIARLDLLDALVQIRDQSDRDPEYMMNLHYTIGPLLYYIYDIYSNLKTDPEITDEMRDYFIEEEKRWSKIYRDEDAFAEWWDTLKKHYRDTGVENRERF